MKSRGYGCRVRNPFSFCDCFATIFSTGLPIRQAFDCFSRVLGGEVRIPLGHHSGLVTRDLTDCPERHPSHRHVGRGCMPEVVKPEPFHL